MGFLVDGEAAVIGLPQAALQFQPVPSPSAVGEVGVDIVYVPGGVEQYPADRTNGEMPFDDVPADEFGERAEDVVADVAGLALVPPA